jgi:hypothetical protein
MFSAPPYLQASPLREPSDRWIVAGLLLSLLLHAGIVWLLREQPWETANKIAAAPLEIEMVIPPPAPAPPPPPPLPQAQQPPPPPEVPQLQRAPLAEKSVAPPPKAATEAPKPAQRAAPVPPPSPQPETQIPQQRPTPRRQEAAPARPMTQEDAQRAVAAAPEMRQSEQDFFLSQIAASWIIDRHAPQFEDVQITGSYVILPNGMLAPPFGKNDPMDMRLMVRNWDQITRMRGAENFKVAAETFMKAMRLAQPLQLPPNFGDKPKRMTLNLRVGDLP